MPGTAEPSGPDAYPSYGWREVEDAMVPRSEHKGRHHLLVLHRYHLAVLCVLFHAGHPRMGRHTRWKRHRNRGCVLTYPLWYESWNFGSNHNWRTLYDSFKHIFHEITVPNTLTVCLVLSPRSSTILFSSSDERLLSIWKKTHRDSLRWIP